jgi:uncharacterized protein (TIGR03083 family)
MTAISEERYEAELVDRTARLAELTVGADPAGPVATCPEWTLRELVEHLGQTHRWAAAIVSAGAFVHPRDVPDAVAPQAAGDRAGWLRAGATLLADAVRRAGFAGPAWSWAEDQSAGFWLRRMVHETAVHHADAALSLGCGWETAPDLGADGVSEWLMILSSPNARTARPELRELDGDGQTLHFHATDGDLGEDGEWLVTWGPSGITWSHEHRRADVAMRGAAGALLLVLMRRIPPADPGVEVLGEAGLLQDWLAHSAF